MVADPGRRGAPAIGIAGAGLTHTFWLTCVLVGLGGLGVAAFHPEGARYANYASGTRRGTGMSLFSVGGNTGFALGPILITPAVLMFGLYGHGAGRHPAADRRGRAGLRAAATSRDAQRRAPKNAARAGRDSREDDAERVRHLTAVVGFRSGVYFGLQSFAPSGSSTSTARPRGQRNAVAGRDAGLRRAGHAGGRAAGGSDRPARVLLGSIIAQIPLLLAFILAPSELVAGVLLAGIGFVTIMSFSVSVVMGQEYLPCRLGIASGVTLGLAIGLGGDRRRAVRRDGRRTSAWRP